MTNATSIRAGLVIRKRTVLNEGDMIIYDGDTIQIIQRLPTNTAQPAFRVPELPKTAQSSKQFYGVNAPLTEKEKYAANTLLNKPPHTIKGSDLKHYDLRFHRRSLAKIVREYNLTEIAPGIWARARSTEQPK